MLQAAEQIEKPGILTRSLIPFFAGICFYRLQLLNIVVPIQLYFSLGILLSIFIIRCLYQSTKVYIKPFFAEILFIFLWLIFGLLCSKAHSYLSLPSYFKNHQATAFKIYVCVEPQLRGQNYVFQAEILNSYNHLKKLNTKGKLLISVKADPYTKLNLNYGKTFLIPAKITEVIPPQNDGEFDYRSWLANQNIYHQCYLLAKEMKPIKLDNGNPLIRFSMALRQAQVQKLKDMMRQPQAFALASALILGYRSDLDEQTLAAYSKTGTIHALSVSGMHVGIIFFVLDFLLKKMDKKAVFSWLKTTLILVLIWGYTILSGYSASVLRSAIMISLFILSKILKKDSGNWHPFCLSAMLLLLYDSALIWDAGCQLSYLAVAGLIYLQPKIEGLLFCKNKWLQKIWSLLALSTAAQVFTFPFSVWYFHQFPLYFLLSNLFITLPVALLMYSGIAILLFNLNWLAPAFEWLIIFMNNGLEKIASLPYPVIDRIWFTKYEMILLCVFILGVCLTLQLKNKMLFYLTAVMLLVLQASTAKNHIKALRQHRLIWFKIKKHHAAALLYGRRAVVYSDLAPTQKDYRFHLQPALDKALIREVNSRPKIIILAHK